MIKSKRMRWAGHVTRMGKTQNAYRIFVEKPERNRPLGRPRRRWVENIKMDLREIGWDGMVWVGSIWLRIGTSEHGDEPSGSLKCWEVPEWLHNWQLLRKGSAP
jgi:hypothetical protein